MHLLSKLLIKAILNHTKPQFTSTCIISLSQLCARPRAYKFSLPSRYAGSEKSVWIEYGLLAAEYKPLNLGQGFPDFAAPDYMTQALAEVALSNDYLLHQYTRGFGHLRLVEEVSKLYSMLIGREINPYTEILITAGGYEAVFSSIMGHVGVGDEVIIIEPFFDCYEPMVKAAGGTSRFIPLRAKKTEEVRSMSSADWSLDPEELEGLFNKKTKMLILNTPNNPLGKVYTLEELGMIANLCKTWDVLCVSDEVYEWLIYKPNEHIRIATLPGMWERTITICSAGKIFSVTGWKIGWAYGPAHLMNNLNIVHQNNIFTCATPLQEAVATALEIERKRLGSPECYFVSLICDLEGKRDYIHRFLLDSGMKPIIPEGGYFMLADWSPLDLASEEDKYKDYRFTKWMTKNVGVQAIPTSVFYSANHKNLGEKYIRFCFIKKEENLSKAARLLHDWKMGKH